MHRAWRSSWLLLACACGGGDAEPPAPQPVMLVPADAALTAGPTAPAEPAFTSRQGAKRAGRPIEVILRSSPAGAKVAVDGVELGVTPTIWLGETGAPHEFTFVLTGYAVARYRFVPVASGVVHPRLVPMAEDRNAPRPPPQMIAPEPAPAPTVVEPEPEPAPMPPADAAP